MPVSINSTSEEVRSNNVSKETNEATKFPLIQLPRKSEVVGDTNGDYNPQTFPLIQLPRKSEGALKLGLKLIVSINSTSEEVRSYCDYLFDEERQRFPLIQLPRKSEALPSGMLLPQGFKGFH